jgi:hypothetical protein
MVQGSIKKKRKKKHSEIPCPTPQASAFDLPLGMYISNYNFAQMEYY